MTDVFISYKRDDRDRCLAIQRKLIALKLDVWFDARLEAGRQFDVEIDREVRSAKVVLVLWSPAAVESKWVRSEARIGQDRDVLCSAFVERAELPVMFVNTTTVDLTQNGFAHDHGGWLDILRRIGYLVGRPGLEEYSKILARPDATTFRVWAERWPDDPLASGASGDLATSGDSGAQPHPVDRPTPRRRASRLEWISPLAAGAVVLTMLWIGSSAPRTPTFAPPTTTPPAPEESSRARVLEALDRLTVKEWHTETGAALFERVAAQIPVEDISALAEEGENRAQVLMGAAYQFGLAGVPRDLMRALQLYAWSAGKTNSLAQFSFGLILETGPQKFRSDVQAAQQHEKAASQGNVSAQYRLGLMYEQGRGGLPQDEHEATRLFELAAAAGHPEAQQKIGQ